MNTVYRTRPLFAGILSGPRSRGHSRDRIPLSAGARVHKNHHRRPDPVLVIIERSDWNTDLLPLQQVPWTLNGTPAKGPSPSSKPIGIRRRTSKHHTPSLHQRFINNLALLLLLLLCAAAMPRIGPNSSPGHGQGK